MVCGVDQPLARMELAPAGGQWCWRCRVTAEIAAHDPPPRSASEKWRRAVLIGAAAIAGLVVLYFLLAIMLLAMHPC